MSKKTIFLEYFPGLLLSACVTLSVMQIAGFVPIIDKITMVLLSGIILGNSFSHFFTAQNSVFKSGLIFSEKKLLEFAIILMGVNFSWGQIKNLGSTHLLPIILIMSTTILSALFFGRLFKLDNKLALLLGSGNAICGSAAIATVGKSIHAPKQDLGLSLAIINFMGTVSLISFPIILRLFQTNPQDSAFIIGGSLQSVGHAVAAGYAVSPFVGELATLIKMLRVILLGPIVIIVSYFYKEKERQLPNLPYFIFGMLSVMFITNFVQLPPNLIQALKFACKLALGMAMFAIGLKINFKSLARSAGPAFATGSLSALIQLLMILFIIKFMN